jgi:hypothetical protein
LDQPGEVRPKLTIPPFLFEDSEGTIKEPISTLDLKYVGDYAGTNIKEVEELNILEFYLLMHDAVVWNLSQTEEGRKRLDKSWVLQQTEPDVGKFPGR